MERGDKNWRVFSMDAARLKGAWNRVMLTLLFKDVHINIVHVATTVCEMEYAEEYKYLVQNVMKFHELRSVLSSESTACFTDGHKRSDAAFPAACPFAHVSYTYVFFRDIYDACNNMKN